MIKLGACWNGSFNVVVACTMLQIMMNIRAQDKKGTGWIGVVYSIHVIHRNCVLLLGDNRHQFEEQQIYFKTRFLVHDYEGLINEHYRVYLSFQGSDIKSTFTRIRVG